VSASAGPTGSPAGPSVPRGAPAPGTPARAPRPRPRPAPRRDEETLEPRAYLNKLPEKFDRNDRILVSDPMLATGGTMVYALDELVARGADPSMIRVVALVCAPPALSKMNGRYPGLKVYTGMIDEEVNERGFIVPGFGDAGDRAFGNLG